MEITKEILETFKERVRIEKCDGEITDVKLSEYIANYNRNNKRFAIYIYGYDLSIIDKIFQDKKNINLYQTGIIDGKLAAMLYVIINSVIQI